MRKVIKFIAVLLILFTFLGCSDSSAKFSDLPVEENTISGIVIDGYVENATVTFNGFQTTTNSDGSWSLTYKDTSDTAIVSTIVSVKGGIDTSTGEAFEGLLEAPISTEKDASNVVTPLTTIAASLVKKGASPETAMSTVADKLGLPLSAITSDPIAKLKNGTAIEKANAASAVKKSLVIQKATEALASSIGGGDEAFSAVMDVVASSMDGTDGKTFDDVMSDTSTIASKVAENTSIKGDNISEKLNAAAAATQSIINSIEAINEADLYSNDTTVTVDVDAVMESKSKALEILSEAIEAKLEIISESATIADITSAIDAVEEISSAITMLGGVEGISTTITQERASLKDGTTLDASTFSDSFLTDEVVSSQSATYDTLLESGFTIDMIMDVGEDISSSADIGADAINSIMEVVVAEAIESGAIETGRVDTTAIETLSDSVSSAAVAAETAVETAVNESEEPAVEPEEPAVEPEEPAVEPEEPAVEPEEPAIEPEEPAVEPEEPAVAATPANSAPVANAGTDQNVSITVTLDGSLSSDVESDTLTYTWSISSAPTGSSAALSNVTVVNPTFIADLDGAYVFKLVVNDGTVDSAEDTVLVNVKTNLSYSTADGWGEQVVAYNGLVERELTITLPVGSYNVYVEPANGNSELHSVIGTILDIDGYAATGDITGEQVLRTTVQSPAKIQITNSSGADKTYVLPVSTINKWTENAEASSIWVGVMEDVTTPSYTTGGVLSIGDLTTNVASILAIDELHTWSFSTDASGAGLYTLSVVSTEDINKLLNFNIEMIVNGTGEEKVSSTLVTSGGFSQSNITLDSSASYQIKIFSSEAGRHSDYLGNYTLKLIKH